VSQAGPAEADIRIVDDVAAAFADTVIESFARRVEPGFTLVLSGGDTARLCYEKLADDGAAAIDWSVVDVLMGDERCVAPDDADANQRLVRESLLDRVGQVSAFQCRATTSTITTACWPGSRLSISCIWASAPTGTRPLCSPTQPDWRRHRAAWPSSTPTRAGAIPTTG
jgi:hypothetical protein